jgi:nucleoid-associated protein YgaU
VQDVPSVSFGGGEPEKLRLKLFFDTTSTGLDVRMYTKPIQMLAYRIPFTASPPLVMVIWGTLMSKPSYINDLDIEYNMFLPQGIPVRAEMSLSLTEYNLGWLSMLPMNPTSVSEARKTWIVVEGQTLDWIAYQEYGSPAAWRHIAETNSLDDPMNLTPGQILKLTPLP